MRIGIVSTMRNEGAHLDEWLRFHRAVGVTDFLIFNHQSTDQTVDVLRRWEGQGVSWCDTAWDGGTPLQIQNLNTACGLDLRWDWIGSIDGDELVVPVAGWSLTELMDRLPESCDGVAINWLMMGERDTPGDSLLNITRCSNGLARVFKSFARLAAVRRYYSVHGPPVPAERVLHDFCRPFVKGRPCCTSGTSGVCAQINHYHWRSRVELDARRRRGWHCKGRGTEGSVEYWRLRTNLTRSHRALEVARKLGVI